MGVSAILFLSFTLVSYVFLILLFLAAGQESMPARNLIEYPVSVIVAARNAKAGLEKLLMTLKDQHYSEFEVVVVDDRSTDETSSMLEELKRDYSWLKVVRIEKTPENADPKKFALTMGIKKAKHDILLFTDSDCFPGSSGWISGMSNSFDSETRIVIGFSNYETRHGLLNYFIRFETLWTGIQYMASAVMGNPYMGVGRNLAYRRSFFAKKKGFRSFANVTGGDDDLFVNKNATSSNTKVALGKEVLTLSQPKIRVKEFLDQKLRHLSVGKRYQLKDKLLLGFFNISFLGTLVITLVLIAKSSVLYWLASFLLVRWLLMMVIIGRWSKILGSPINVIGVPILDILYLFYYIFTGTRALFIKKVKWT